MKKVRFLETCYLFSTEKFYNLNDEEDLTDKEAQSLFDKKIVDILKEEKKVERKSTKSTKKETPKKKDEK